MLRELERTRLVNALQAVGFKSDSFNNWFGQQFLYKLLSDKDHSIIISLSSGDTIDSIAERAYMTAFKTRGITKVSKREIYSLGDRLKRAYEQEAFRDPTGGGNINK